MACRILPSIPASCVCCVTNPGMVCAYAIMYNSLITSLVSHLESSPALKFLISIIMSILFWKLETGMVNGEVIHKGVLAQHKVSAIDFTIILRIETSTE